MISRRTSRVIAEVYEKYFREYHHPRHGDGYYNLNTEAIYDFLFDNNYPAWFCNLAKNTLESYGTRKFKEFIMRLHTGESVVSATKEWTWKQRELLGQENLHNLAKDVLSFWSNMRDEDDKKHYAHDIDTLTKNLELDGYSYKNHQLLVSESDVLDTQEETGVLETTFTSLLLNNKETAFHHLKLSEEHYLASKWDDSISNSRKFLEAVLQEVTYSHFLLVNKTPISDELYSRPVKVREYLEKQGLLETKEKEALASVYGLLSDTGSHPYIAQNEQARLLRHLAFTFAQFVMLRFQGFKMKSGG
jgi:hypothetical protein